MRLLLLLGLDLPFARFHQRFIVQLVLCVCVGMGGKVKPFRRKAENERYVCDFRGRREWGGVVRLKAKRTSYERIGTVPLESAT